MPWPFVTVSDVLNVDEKEKLLRDNEKVLDKERERTSKMIQFWKDYDIYCPKGIEIDGQRCIYMSQLKFKADTHLTKMELMQFLFPQDTTRRQLKRLQRLKTNHVYDRAEGYLTMVEETGTHYNPCCLAGPCNGDPYTYTKEVVRMDNLLRDPNIPADIPRSFQTLWIPKRSVEAMRVLFL